MWLKLGFAPEPVNIRKNIQDFSLKYPLEYKEIMDEYNTTVSNYDLIPFTVYNFDRHQFSFKCNLHKKYLYSISFYKANYKITLHSIDGYTFEKPMYEELKVHYTLPEFLYDKKLQKMLGITYATSTKIVFQNTILRKIRK